MMFFRAAPEAQGAWNPLILKATRMRVYESALRDGDGDNYVTFILLGDTGEMALRLTRSQVLDLHHHLAGML